MPSNKTKPLRGQKKLIFEHLQRRGSITAIEALIIYKCFRLAARVKDLRDYGVSIRTEIRTDPKGAKYARYHLDTHGKKA
jgi:hypothetical protein